MPNLPSTPIAACLESIAPFLHRSSNESTRKAYKQTISAFCAHFRGLDPASLSSSNIISWRDDLKTRLRLKPATIAFKLTVIRSLYEWLKEEGRVSRNPASIASVPPPNPPDHPRGRALSGEEVGKLLRAPDRSTVIGSRDYALILLMLRTSIRVSEAIGLLCSSRRWSHGRWVLKVRVKGRTERTIPLPEDVREAIDAYIKLDRTRREIQHTSGPDSPIFQPTVNYRTLEFNKPINRAQAFRIVSRWADFAGLGKLSPHDLRRTAITRALDQGLSIRQVQMMSGHRDPKTVMKYDHNRANLDLNAINFLTYGDEKKK